MNRHKTRWTDVKVIFDITQELDTALYEMMERRQISKAAICRTAITKYLESEGIYIKSEQNQSKQEISHIVKQ